MSRVTVRQQPLTLMLSPIATLVQAERARGEHELHVTAARRDRAYFADCLNDTCEHGL